MASNRPGFYRSEVGYPSPTSSQNLASKNAQYLPKMDKIHYYRHKINKKSKNYIIKNPLLYKNMGAAPFSPRPGHMGASMWPGAIPPGRASPPVRLAPGLRRAGHRTGANNLTPRALFWDRPPVLVMGWPEIQGLALSKLPAYG
jgi:hypothetical protein